ncbi:type VI secretion system protein TssA [Stenotrophomonas sp. 24(2023)]|uniref:type VI secretion system protein TssA n=1 Tax=Stenotrophomonas sp. 24(2023) TaxID=3068324 RepID=UPI0027E0489F|nr:type VI secretion system protein TssA [Stenotrophomonas sp. 24(2023)]WMJ69522.1 type VI secretion system protein TssA [Stenotrophomonas sp. 24(2023)]
MLDQDALLAPISDDAPTGEDLSFSAEFDRIIENRRADDPTLDQGAWQTDIKYADWSSVLRDSSDLLQARTKDLRVAGWLSEAAAQIEGFKGLAAGYRVTAGLCERYWDQVHPQAPDGDHEERIGNLSWLLTNSLQWLRNVPIVVAPQGRFTLADFEHAHARANGNAEDDGRPGLDVLDAARRDTQHSFYRQLADELPDCSQALVELQGAVDNRLGLDGPSFSAVREQLEHLQRTVQRFARDAGVLLDGETGDLEGDAGGDVFAAAPSPFETVTPVASRGPGGAPGTRKEALQQLRQVAEFFRRTEPHSPVAYLAEKAARWGEMPLHVWLKRVIKDHGTLEQMEEMLDIGPED